MAEIAREKIVDRRSDHRCGSQDRYRSTLTRLAEAQHFVFRFDLVEQEGLGTSRSQWMLFGEKVRVRRVSAVEQRLAPHDELLHFGAPTRVQDVHRAHALELVRERGSVGRGREEREVDQGIHPLGAQCFGHALFGRWLGQIELVETGFLSCCTWRLRVHRNDGADRGLFLEHADQVRPEESRRSGHCYDPTSGRPLGEGRCAGRVVQGTLFTHASGAPFRSDPTTPTHPFCPGRAFANARSPEVG